ncbi:MAG: aldehyde dehydrogenase family protein [Eubacterium sp.]|nr:aldehyde dehydrogenase family protein [Eubacterium sp.]
MNEKVFMAEDLLKNQKDYFYTGQTKSIDFRIAELKKLKKAIKKHEEKIMFALEKDLGKAGQESFLTEIGNIYGSIDLFIKKLAKWTRKKSVMTPIFQYGESYVEYEPYGCVLIIVPFNYPFQLAMEPLIGAMASGNTVVIKPSEMAEATEKVIVDIIREAFDEKYIATVTGGADVITKLLNLRFDYIFFTGSVRVGKVVMAAAAKNLTPLTLELGGKSPVFVDDSFDIKLAARRIIWGKLLNNGQTCIAPDYVMVKREQKNRLIEELSRAIKEFYGENIKENPDYGRIINKKQARRLADIIEADRELIVFGGGFDIEERFIEPTLFDLSGDGRESAVMQDEIFGPLLPIISFDNLDEAIASVRIFEKPLAMYIFSRDKDFVESLKKGISCGNISINDTIKHVSIHSLPFGGVGQSGLGEYHGKYSIEAFSHRRGVYRNKMNRNIKQILPPYNQKNFDFLRKLFK